LLKKVLNRDWRKLSYDEIRRYLIFVFGENPARSGNGVLVRREGKKWLISFKGRIQVEHELVDGNPVSKLVKAAAADHNRNVRKLLNSAGNRVSDLKGLTDLREKQTPSK
jgi:hypothetical protein